jgi:hypothetical protein
MSTAPEPDVSFREVVLVCAHDSCIVANVDREGTGVRTGVVKKQCGKCARQLLRKHGEKIRPMSSVESSLIEAVDERRKNV